MSFAGSAAASDSARSIASLRSHCILAVCLAPGSESALALGSQSSPLLPCLLSCAYWQWGALMLMLMLMLMLILMPMLMLMIMRVG